MHEPYWLIVLCWSLWLLQRTRPFHWLRRQLNDFLELLAAVFDARINLQRRRHRTARKRREARSRPAVRR